MLIKNFNNLNLSKERKIALTIVETGLRALNYKKVIQEKFFNKYLPQIKRYRKIYLIGFGKGSSQVADILRKRISFKEIYVIDLIMVQTNANNTGIESILNRRKSVLNSHKSVGIFTKGTHPLPSLKNFQFTEKVIRRFSGQLTKNDLVIVVVCGGGSAMLTYPCLSQTLADYTHLPAGRQGLNADNIKSQNHAERTQNLQNISIKASKNGRISSGEGSHKFTNYPQTHTEDNFRIDPFNNPQLSALLKKYIQINQQLLKSGADIYEMNTIRKHLDLVKGGGLAKILYPAKVISLIFSDVPGNDLSFIASGPTVKDKTTIKDALRIIKKYKLKIKKEDLIETSKEDKYFKNVENVLVLSNLTALKAMKEKAKRFGLKAKILTDNLREDIKELAKYLLKEIKNTKADILLVGGETTVKVRGEGKGGRNQELVMWFLKYAELTELTHLACRQAGNLRKNKNFLIISINSDGWDNTQFAGAIGDKITLEKAKKLNLNFDDFLTNNDSYNFFRKVKDGIITGRLPINVSDLILVWKI